MTELYDQLSEDFKNLGDDNFCGPLSLSIVAKISAEKSRNILQLEGRQNKGGTFNWMINRALLNLGYEETPLRNFSYLKKYKTFITLGRKLPKNEIFLIGSVNHYAAISNGFIHDFAAESKRRIVEIRRFKKTNKMKINITKFYAEMTEPLFFCLDREKLSAVDQIKQIHCFLRFSKLFSKTINKQEKERFALFLKKAGLKISTEDQLIREAIKEIAFDLWRFDKLQKEHKMENWDRRFHEADLKIYKKTIDNGKIYDRLVFDEENVYFKI